MIDVLHIGQAARRLGVTPEYLRVLEREGHLPQARRDPSERLYSHARSLDGVPDERAAFAIMRVFEENGEPLTSTEVADALDKPVYTVKQRTWQMSRVWAACRRRRQVKRQQGAPRITATFITILPKRRITLTGLRRLWVTPMAETGGRCVVEPPM